MNKYKKGTNKNHTKQNDMILKKIDTLMFFTAVLMLIICPIILRVYKFHFVGPFINTYYFSTGNTGEMFNFYKYLFLIVGMIVLVSSLIVKLLLNYNLIETKYNYIIFSLLILLIISTFFSPYKSIALFGNKNRWEGAMAYISYFFVFLSILNMKLSSKQRYILIFSTIPFLFVNVILGLLDFYNYHLLDTSWAKVLFGFKSGLKLHADSKIASTLPNANYISGASGFLFSLFFSLMIFERNRKMKFVSLALSIASVILCLVSLTKSGAVVSIIMFLLIIITGLILKRDEWKLNSILVIIFISVSVLGFIKLVNHNKEVWNESIGIFIKSNPFEKTIANDNETKQNENDTESMSLQKEIPNKFKLPTLPEAGTGKLNGRAYIWEQGFNAWKKKPFFGYGLETFGFDINQYEIHKAESLRKYDHFLDKPHSIYLGWLIGTGIFTFLAFMVFLGTVYFDFIKSLLKKSENALLISLGFMTLAYCAQGIVNDTTEGTSVIFWIFIALLVKEMVSEQNKNKIT
ncbi:MAG: O-antigen polymerase [Bacillales bacterium]|jgi:hypothetical protein|nr:O-antigen polymerase [Bacillales bacterium]